MSEVDEQTERARQAREALIGKSIADRYVLRALVGHGGMGAVYEAEHLGLGKRVAIKFVDPEFATDERVVARFAREARAMSAIESAHIVTVFDAGTDDGRPYLVMELLRGEDLGQRLRRTRRVPVHEALHVIAQVLKGLAKAHAAGIVHRDLKPDNVFLVKSDSDPLFAKIVDFGVSKIERPRDKTSPLALTGRGTVLGTPFYMGPEQAQAMPDIDARADLYSVGAILFECLSGRPPHTGETYEQIILSICMRDAPDLRSIDASIAPEVAAFVSRALARERTDRFGSAERMLAALHEIAPDEKTRVPLDVVAHETLASPGVLFPIPNKPPSTRGRAGVSAATRIGGSAGADVEESESAPPRVTPGPSPVAAGPSPSASAPSPGARIVIRPAGANGASSANASNANNAKPSFDTAAALSAAGLRPRGTRSFTAIIVTAALAMFTGVGVMLGIIVMLDKKTATQTTSRPPPTITSGLATGRRGSDESIPPVPSSAVAAGVTNAGAGSINTPADASPPSPSAPGPSAPGPSAPGPSAPGTRASTPTPSTPGRSSGASGPVKPAPTKLDISRDLP